MLFLIVYIVNGLMAPTTYGASIDFTTTKPILCTFYGNKIYYKRPETPVADACTLPKECEVIPFSGFEMSSSSEPIYTKYLDQVLQLNRTLLLEVIRTGGFQGWQAILTPDGNEEDAKALTDFLTSKRVVITSITPLFGKFFHDQNYGVLITWTELDDVNNSCGPFIAVINIAAGYKGEQQIPCVKFDIKDNTP